jgi:hypothetical protein
VANKRGDQALKRRGLRLASFIIVWDVIEGIVAVTAGLIANSIALVGFGIDSSIEVFAAALARLWAERGLGHGAPVSLVGDFLRLSRGKNSGTTFGLLQESPLVPWLAEMVAFACQLALLPGPAGAGRPRNVAAHRQEGADGTLRPAQDWVPNNRFHRTRMQPFAA